MFGVVLTSPRQRARETARLAGFPEAQVDEDLAEWVYGDYEGVTTATIRETVPGWSVWTHPTPGGESADGRGYRLAPAPRVAVDPVHGEASLVPCGRPILGNSTVNKPSSGRKAQI